jgi:hypothetical protein
MDFLLKLELMEHLALTAKLLLLLIDWMIICSFPMMFKVVMTYTKKYLAKHGAVPSVNYLPESLADKAKRQEIENPTPELQPLSTFEDDMKRIREEKTRKYNLISIDDLRELAKDIGKSSGFRIKGYYKMDKPSLIEAIIQTEEIIEIEKAKEEASEAVDKAKEDSTDEIENDAE